MITRVISRLRHSLVVVRLVHLRELRLHPLRTFIAVVSVAAGVAMVLSVVVVVSATTASFERQAEGLAGPAPLRVVGSTSAGGLLPADVWTIAATDGVAGIGPMVRGVVQVEEMAADGLELTSDVIVLGVECPTAEVLGVSCADLDAGLVASPALASLDRDGIALRTTIGPVDLAPVAVADGLRAIAPRTAVVALAEAQRLFQRGDRIDVVYVLPADDVSVADVSSRLSGVLPGGLDVLAVTDPPPEFGQVLATIVPLFGLIGLLALGIGMILVSNAVALSLEERRLQLAVVGALGGTTGQIVVGALVQATLLGLAGGLLGTAGAVALAAPLTDSVSTFTLPISGVAVEASAADAPVVLGLLLGAIVAGTAAWRPARRAQRTDVAGELSRRDRRSDADATALAPRALFVVAIGVCGAGLAAAGGTDGSLEPWQPIVGLVGLLVSILGLTLAMGRVTALAATLVLRRATPRVASVRLALANLAREPSRTGVMAVGVGAAVGTAFLVASFAESSRAGIIEGITSEIGDQLALTVGAPDGNDDVFHSVPPTVVAAIGERADVARVDRESFVFSSDGGAAIAIEGTEAELRDLGLTIFDGTADPDRFRAGEVMIGAGLARAQGIRAGDMVEVPVRDGLAEVPVQGVWANGNAVGNSITMPYSMVQELFGPVPVDNLSLTPVEGTSIAELASAIDAAPPDPAVRVESARQVAGRVADSVDAQLAPFWALQRGLTAVAFVAVLSTMLLVGIQRTRELGLLAAVGMEPRTIAAMILLEAFVVGVLGVVVAAFLSTVMALALSSVTPLIIGWENPIRFAFGAVPVYGTITVALAVAGAALPAWRASRVQVVEALAYE